ncbi:MAG TPA: hypothetical protein VF945_21625 [Polyangia bacterium]
MKRALVALVLLSSVSALAQPMMIDPSKMSGIPRPDPQVPPGTITVRLIRGELSNRMPGIEVGLVGSDGKAQKQKTDDQGRATFAGLAAPGPYTAKATDGVEELSSQPIELQDNMGSRVMLVFQPAGGAADGAAHPDKTLPAGTIVVRAAGEGGEPLPGVDVVLGHARAGERAVQELKGKTDAKGEAKFTGLDAKPESGYLAEAIKDGQRFAGKPFKLQENMGSRVTIDVRPVSKDVAALRIGPGSHFIFEVTDDVVQVAEVWRLMNTSSTAVDPGPNGLHLPLAEHALSAQGGPQNPPNVTIAGHEVVVKGPIAPGDTELQVIFALAYDGATLDFEQRTPLPFDDVAMVTEKIEGLTVEGNALTSEDRELQGRKLVLYRGPGTQPNGSVVFHLRGLPHNDATWRYLASAIALALLVGFGIYAARGSAGKASRERLEQQREHLLGELAALEKTDGGEKRERKKQELTARLVRVYRELDELR